MRARNFLTYGPACTVYKAKRGRALRYPTAVTPEGTRKCCIWFAISRSDDGKLHGGSDPVVRSSGLRWSTPARMDLFFQYSKARQYDQSVQSLEPSHEPFGLLLVANSGACPRRMESILSCPNRSGGAVTPKVTIGL